VVQNTITPSSSPSGAPYLTSPFPSSPPLPRLTDHCTLFYEMDFIFVSTMSENMGHLLFCSCLISLAQCCPVLSTLTQMTEFHSFLWSNNTTSCIQHFSFQLAFNVVSAQHSFKLLLQYGKACSV
jgi:hypothetical protein